MDFTHDFFVGFAKSFGLFWLIGLSIAVTVYAFWPSLGKRFDRAAKSILDDEAGPAKQPDLNSHTREERAECQ